MSKEVKTVNRTEIEKKKLDTRLKILEGQIRGIEEMIKEDRYCGDILIQLSSIASGIKSISREILKNHINTCVKENLSKGNTDIIDEVLELIRRLN